MRRTPTSKRTRPGRITMRSFREADEQAIAALFNAYMAPFVGPIRVTPETWRRQYRRHSWNSPSLGDDKQCCRLALRSGKVIGYAVTDYDPMWESGSAMIQELCVAEGEEAEEVMRALVGDAERTARARGSEMLVLRLSNEDGASLRVAEAMGFEPPDESGGVFMAAITDLARFLEEIEPELTRRLSASALRDWRGSIRLSSGDMTAGLRVRAGAVKVGRLRGAADLSVSIEPEVLPLLLLGQTEVGEAFLQNRLSVTAPDRHWALRLLDALFPRVPLYLPRAQWW